MEHFKIRISRFNPETDRAPKLEEFSVPSFNEGTVLEALIYIYDNLDSTLLFSYGCRYKACGKCAVRVNGQPAMACETALRDGMVIEPLDHFPVIRDLAVDRSGLLEPLRKNKVLARPAGQECPAVQPPEFFQVSQCNECLACVSECPSIRPEGYGGPLFGVKLAELYYDVRNEGDLRGTLGHYLEECSGCRRCAINCPSSVNFSDIAIKIKGRLAESKTISLRDRLLSHPEPLGRLALLCPSVINRLSRSKTVRQFAESVLGIEARMPLPAYGGEKIRSKGANVRVGRRVFYFLGCFNKFNDPGPARDTIWVLEKVGHTVEVFDEGCCGMPLIGAGDLGAARKKAERLSKKIQRIAQSGEQIIVSCPSCETMLKEEYPALFNLLVDDKVGRNINNVGVYLKVLQETHPYLFAFHAVEAVLGYQIPCHAKTPGKGTPYVDLLRQVPGLNLERVFDKCCGMAGTLGYKKEKYGLCERIGKELIDDIRVSGFKMIASECAACQSTIRSKANTKVVHPISILRESMNGS